MSVQKKPFSFFVATNHQRVMSFLAKYSDREFYEREIARQTGISFGSANKALNDLFSAGILIRQRKGRMAFYRFNPDEPLLGPYKILVSIAMLRPLVAKLKPWTSRLVLFGSCARGEDTSESDIDLFIIANKPNQAAQIVRAFHFSRGFREISIKPVILSTRDLLRSEKTEPEFQSLVNEGIVLWEWRSHETGIPGVPE
jgi:predicted nucleotidyltransferase